MENKDNLDQSDLLDLLVKWDNLVIQASEENVAPLDLLVHQDCKVTQAKLVKMVSQEMQDLRVQQVIQDPQEKLDIPEPQDQMDLLDYKDLKEKKDLMVTLDHLVHQD